MALAVDCFWSFRSPYSYLATDRLVRLAAELDVDLGEHAASVDRPNVVARPAKPARQT
jgi:2-hydroxychromene-2-carboxylate isomerase